MQLVDEQNDVLGTADFIHHGLDAFLELAAILGAGDHQRQVERDDALVSQQFGHIAFGYLLGQTFHNRRLAHTRFTQQNRVVLGAATEDLNHALDLVLAPDDRVHLAFAGDLGQIAAKRFQRGRLDFALFLGWRLLRALARRRILGRLEIGIEFLQNLLSRLLDIDIQVLEHARGDAVAFAQQAQQNMLGADVSVIQRLGFLRCQGQNLFNPRCVGDVADHLLVGAGADLLLDFHPDGLQVEPHFLEHVDGDALAKFDQAEQQVLGADEIVIEAVSFFARQRQYLLRSRREIIHGFIAHSSLGSTCFERRHLSSVLRAWQRCSVHFQSGNV